jgi:hypothetical protein
MHAADDFFDRQIGHWCIHMRDEMQARRPRPCAFDGNIREVISDELRDGMAAIHMRNELEVDLGFAQFLL